MELTTANGTKIPALAFGTWPLQGAEATEAVRHALELGYRHIDTAEAYENEDAVGAGLRASGLDRNDIFLTTKFQKQWQGRTDRHSKAPTPAWASAPTPSPSSTGPTQTKTATLKRAKASKTSARKAKSATGVSPTSSHTTSRGSSTPAWLHK